MKDKATVSIIMPIYKCADFVRQSILSIENQTYPHIELLCINDGTPDNSFQICQELAKQYNNIVLLENDKNRGQEYTRNQGLAKATGKYLLFLDSDDTLSLDCIERLVTLAEENSSDIVFFTYSRLINGTEHPIKLANMPEGTYTLKQLSAHFLSEMHIGVLSCIGSKLYRTEFIKEHNLSFEYKYKYNEDGAFALCAMMKTDNIYFVNQPFYKYLIRTEGSTMTSYRPNMFSTVTKTRELIKDIFIKSGAWEKIEKKTLYYSDILALMLNSLMNEEKFGNKRSFREVGETIRSYKDFDEMCEVLYQTKSLSKTRKLILPFIKRRNWSVVYLFVKIQRKKA